MKFEWNELLLNILYICLVFILPLVVKYVVNFLDYIIKQKAEQIKDEKIQEYICNASDAVRYSVIDVCQTYVDSLKASGQFTKEAQEIAKQMAIEKAVAMITEEGKRAIETVYKDFDVWMNTSIETIVRQNKITV